MKVIIDESRIEHSQPKLWKGSTTASLSRWLRTLVNLTPVNPPYRYKGIKGWFKLVRVDALGKTIRIEPKSLEENLEVHMKRLKFYDMLSTAGYFVFTFLVTTTILIYVIDLVSQTKSELINILLSSSISLIAMILSVAVATLITKILSILLDQCFADSLILLSSLYLVMDLGACDDLSNPEYKRHILERVRILRRNVLLLSRTFIANDADQNQDAFLQFKRMEWFIRAREGWVITPKKGTLEALRKDFEDFALLLISGRYGEFKSSIPTQRLENDAPRPPSFGDKLLQVVFTLFPYMILAILYFRPEYISSNGFDATTVFLASVVWILLTIDVRLRLGLVDRVSSVVKTIKELS